MYYVKKKNPLNYFQGILTLVVSHDRWFLDRICTHILAFENNSEVRFFEGNWSEYAEWKKEQFGEDASVPKRVQYRKLSR